MAVRVEFPREWSFESKTYNGGGQVVHEDGEAIDHDDGAVLVLGNVVVDAITQRADVRHVYAPGEWVSAHIEDRECGLSLHDRPVVG